MAIAAEAVLAHLRDGAQTAAEIQLATSLTKREVDHALWTLMSQGRVEYAYPTTSPLAYEARV